MQIVKKLELLVDGADHQSFVSFCLLFCFVFKEKASFVAGSSLRTLNGRSSQSRKSVRYQINRIESRVGVLYFNNLVATYQVDTPHHDVVVWNGGRPSFPKC